MPIATHGDVRLHYEVSGDAADTVVLVPGLGMAGVMWAAVAEHLVDEFKLVIINPRGSGASDAPDAPYTPQIVAADLAAVLDDAGVDQAHIVGLSMGGCIAQDFAIRYPDRVLTLTMLSTWASSDDWITRLMEFRRDLIKSAGIKEQFRISFMVISSPFAFRDIPQQLQALEQAMYDNPPREHAYLRQIEYCIQHDSAAQLRVLEIPAQVITGSHDFLTPPTLGKELAGALDATYEEIEHGSHCLTIESPEHIADRIRGFVREHTTSNTVATN